MLPSAAASMHRCGVVMRRRVASMHGKVVLSPCMAQACCIHAWQGCVVSVHGHGVVCVHTWVQCCLQQVHLPTTTEFTAAFVPLLLFESQPCQHIGNALVCVIPACCLELVHSRLQTIICAFAACTNSACESARCQATRPR